jgi:hypothetical protein
MKGDRKVRKILITVGIVLVLVLALTAPVYAASKTDMLKYKADMTLGAYGPEGATGKVVATQPGGKASAMPWVNFGVSAEGLDPNTDFDVWTCYNDTTWEYVGSFTTDEYGNGSLGFSWPGALLTLDTYTVSIYYWDTDEDVLCSDDIPFTPSS